MHNIKKLAVSIVMSLSFHSFLFQASNPSQNVISLIPLENQFVQDQLVDNKHLNNEPIQNYENDSSVRSQDLHVKVKMAFNKLL